MFILPENLDLGVICAKMEWKQENQMKTSKVLGMGLIVVVIWLAGSFWGGLEVKDWVAEISQKNEEQVEVGKTITTQTRPEIDDEFLDEVLGLALERFWKTEEVKSEDLTWGAAVGLIEGLGDRYSEFFPPEDANEFLIAVDGELSGIGAEIGYDDSRNVIVVAPLPESPAEKSGVRAKDMILAVDEESVMGWTVEEVVKKIRGPKGTEVTLMILHEGEKEAVEIVIKRDQIHLQSLKAEKREDGILEIRIVQFDEDTPRELSKVIDNATGSGSEILGVLLDLRANVGGFFEGAISVAGEFLEPGTVVVLEKKAEEESSRMARGLGRLKDLPIVVLVDSGTASAAEILAGALQKMGGAILVGQVTFGKGTVQEIIEFPDGSALKVTVAEWLLPDGSPVNEVGIIPNKVVEFLEEDWQNGFDRQRDEGERILLEQISQK